MNSVAKTTQVTRVILEAISENMFRISHLTAPTAGVFSGAWLAVSGFPAWAMLFIVLSFGIYVYLQR